MIKCQRALWLLCFALFTVILNAQNINPWHIDGEIYLKYKNTYILPQLPPVTEGIMPVLPGIDPEIVATFGIYNVKSTFAAATDKNLNQTLRVFFNKTERISELIAALQAKNFIEYAEPVPYNTTGFTPNDLGDNTTKEQWSLWKIKAQEAWEYSKGDSTITVAVVDDEVNVYHPDLFENIWRNPNEIAGNNIDDDNNGYIDDIYGYDVADIDNNPVHPNTSFTHGTHVAGISGAVTNNNGGIASIGFNISIIAVKCTYNGQTSTVQIPAGFEGITYAANAGADIINCSWSSASFSQTGQNIIDYALTKGCMVVAAASNENVEDLRYPAHYNGVISVASTDIKDQKSSFSNYGTWVDISAPGDSIYSSIVFQNSYANFSGTSMASPLVAGLLGLMKSHNPYLTNAQLEKCLLDSADDIYAQNPNYLGKLGAGRINAEKSMQCVSASLNTKPKARIQSSSTITCPNTTVNYMGSTTAGNADSYKWYFTGGNPATSTIANPTVEYTAKGIYDVTLVITNSKGNDSITLANYIEVSANGSEVFFERDFENGTLEDMGFTIENPDSLITWTITNVNGVPDGARALTMPFYNYSAVGERDGLITPVLDFSNNSGISLNLRHAYRLQNNNKRDSLIIYVSTDSGKTFSNRVAAFAENGSRSFATQTNLATAFSPKNSADWCFETITGAGCLDIDLSAFDGMAGIVLKFEAYNAFGNNLYIDKMSISGYCSGYNTDKPSAVIINSDTDFCYPGLVSFANKSKNYPTTSEWIFEGGIPATSTDKNPIIVYDTPGVYDVTLITGNAFGYDTLVFTDYITAAPKPLIAIAAGDTQFCRGQNTTLIASGANQYLWLTTFAISSTTKDTVIVSPTTSFTYKVRGTSTFGCVDTGSISIAILPGPGLVSIFLSKTRDSLYTTHNAANATYEWLLDGTPIPNQTAKAIKMVGSGNYSLRATDSLGCQSTSAVFYFNPLSTTKVENAETIKVYPNPASGVLNISGTDADKATRIVITDMLGKKVLETMATDNNTVDITAITAGLYIITISQQDGLMATKKICIE
jgi:subtilisin family serine protease